MIEAVAQGATITSVAGYTLSFNGLDSNINPTSGLYAELKQDFAGLGGDVNFVRTTGDLRYYYPLFNDWVLMLRGQAGMSRPGRPDLRIMDNFFMGPNLVRGFAPSGIGPRDIASAELDSWAAQPIGAPRLKCSSPSASCRRISV